MGSLTTVTYYVREQKRRTKEVFLPLSHRPGHAQVDFGETLGVIGGVECKIHFFVLSLPHSDAVFVKGYPAETTEAFCDGHVSAFAFFGGIPQSILYDILKRFLIILSLWGFPRERFSDSLAARRIVSCPHRCHRISAIVFKLYTLKVILHGRSAVVC